MKSVFTTTDVNETLERIEKLSPNSTALWGSMSVGQMLAHCCVSYEMVYTDKHPKPNAIVRLLLKVFVKGPVVGPKPYKKNTPTAPAFRITEPRDFEREKQRLIEYIQRVLKDGESFFDGKESLSFGKLSKEQWNTLFYKHLDHHLQQFGV